MRFAMLQTKWLSLRWLIPACLILPCAPMLGGETNQNVMRTPSESPATNASAQVRPEIKRYLDELPSYNLVSLEHTTDSEPPPPTRHKPAEPADFDAGRFKILFTKGMERRAMICQTEALVGHYARVTPGKTKVGGFVEVLDNPASDQGPARKLTTGELDYLVQGLYRRFSKPLTDDQAALLNRVKDCSLAVLFSGREGLEQYHAQQVKKLGLR